MTKYEELLDLAEREGVLVFEDYDFSGTRIHGLYCDGAIALSNDLKTTAEKVGILCEELGHHYTTVGNILDQSKPENRKQERTARLRGYRMGFGLQDIIDAYKYGCRNRYEIAEHAGVTESYVQEAVDTYKSVYGAGVRHGDYMIYFEPLGVLEILE